MNKDENDEVVKVNALQSKKVQPFIDGKTIVKIIVVKNKIVSIVVK